MRIGLVVVLVAVASGCGAAQRASGPPARPPAESVQQRNAPPPAWIESKSGGSQWLQSGSSCWTSGDHTICADTIAPSCDQPGIPHVRVAIGEAVRAHLGFDPDEASVEGEAAQVHGRIVIWKVSRGGVFAIFAKTRRGDASYSGCAVLTTTSS